MAFNYCKMRGSDGPVWPLTPRKIRLGFVPCDEHGNTADSPLAALVEPAPAEPVVEAPAPRKRRQKAEDPAPVAAPAEPVVAAPSEGAGTLPQE